MFTKEQLLEVYDRVVGGHPEYQRMTRMMARGVKGRVLEVGAGTGLLTAQLLMNQAITKLVLIEPDVLCIKKFREKLPHLKVLPKNGLTFRPRQKFDSIAMGLVYHHIPDEKKKSFLQNMRRNLREGGTLVIGDIFLLPYNNEHEKNHSLTLFHEARIKRAKDRVVQEVERQALMDGLKRNGEYKTSSEVLRQHLIEVGLTNLQISIIGNQTAGGYKMVTSTKLPRNSPSQKDCPAHATLSSRLYRTQ